MEKEIHKTFRFSLAGDAVFTQTMLMKSNFKIKDMDMDSSSNLRLIDRTRPERKNSPQLKISQNLIINHRVNFF